MQVFQRIALSVCLFLASAAEASKPVQRTLTGCVVDGTFYSVDGRAYRISVSNVDLTTFEGKGVSMRGWLSPGDGFALEKDDQPEVKQPICPAASLRLIKEDIAIDLSIKAVQAAKDGAFERAVQTIERALAVVTPPACNLVTDHARIMALKGELTAVAKDLSTLEAKKCDLTTRMNPLLLHDLGKDLLAKGAKAAAIRALQLAMSACDGDWCRPDIARDLQSVNK